MANQDGLNEVLTRRLRPVYDHIDLGNNKKALQEVEKVLKKTPKLQNGRALKALSLIRLGREKESQVIIDELENEEISDESTLQVMTYWYKETEQLEKICKVYTNAVKKQPGNEDLLTQLFMAHVRVNDYKSQQTVALQLYKAKPKNPYYFWAVWSIVLQALRGPDSSNKDKAKMLLSLAQRMIDKIISEGKLDAEQEVQLYLSILQYQEKYKETLEFLEGQLCENYYPGAPISMKIELYKKLNRWGDLNKLMKQLLLEDPDRWDYHQDYLTSCFELLKADDKSEGVDNTIELCYEFICQLIENKEKKVRGPYLARLELHKRMKENNMNADELLGDYLDLLVEYFHIFGDKKCCANDLKLFIEFLEPYRRPGLASKLIKNSGISSTTLPQNKEQLQKHICSLQISRICGAHASLTVDHLQALYSAFSLHYEHSFQAFGSNLLPTDIGPSDQYALLAAHVMYDLSIKTKSSDRLVEALHLLNYLLKNSPSNFHAKLLCLQIYHILGCTLGAHKIYESLDIKHVQLDSMGYLHCAHLASSGIPTISKPLYDQSLKFFTQSYKDSLEYLAMSYKFGSFSKLQEFMDFREKLSNSLHYSLVSVEALLLEICCFNGNYQQNLQQFNNMKIEPNEDRIKYDELTDNRDLEVIVRWDPTYQYIDKDGATIEPIPIHQKVKENEKQSFTQNVELLQMRSCLLRYVAASVDLIAVPYIQNTPQDVANGDTKNSEQADKEEIYTILIESWRELYDRIKKLSYEATSSEFLVNLLPSRLHQMIKLPYEVIFTCLGKFVLNLWMGNNKTSATQQSLIKSFDSVLVFLKSLQNTDDIWYHKNCRDAIVGCVEILSLCSFVLSNCYERYSQLCHQSQHGKKKKQQSQTNSINHIENCLNDKERVSLVAEVLRALKTCFLDVETVIDKWQPKKIEKSLNEYLASLSITPKPSENNKIDSAATTAITIVDINVYTIFTESHQQTTKELKNLIKDKLKMINVK